MTNNKAFPPITETISISIRAGKATQPRGLILSDQLHQDEEGRRNEQEEKLQRPCSVLLNEAARFSTSPTGPTLTSERFPIDWPASLRPASEIGTVLIGPRFFSQSSQNFL